jgi:ketosteroid isomerase-like protein
MSPRKLAAVLGGVLAVCAIAVKSQDNGQARKDDEQAIRQAITAKESKFTEDAVFMSGGYDHPLVGRGAIESARRLGDASGARPNQATAQQLEKIVISQAGDMAYEYESFSTTWDAPNQQRTGSVETVHHSRRDHSFHFRSQADQSDPGLHSVRGGDARRGFRSKDTRILHVGRYRQQGGSIRWNLGAI